MAPSDDLAPARAAQRATAPPRPGHRPGVDAAAISAARPFYAGTNVWMPEISATRTMAAIR
jgi:hypothetical protein